MTKKIQQSYIKHAHVRRIRPNGKPVLVVRWRSPYVKKHA